MHTFSSLRSKCIAREIGHNFLKLKDPANPADQNLAMARDEEGAMQHFAGKP